MEKHLKRGKGYDQHRKLEINTTGEETIMKDDELEAREHLHEGSRIRTLIEKSEVTSHE